MEDGMNAGRELDALVAEKVMGMEYRPWKAYCAPEGWYPRDAPDCNERNVNGDAIDAHGYVSELPFYSTDIAAAWPVVEKLKRDGYFISVGSDKNQPGWACEVDGKYAPADTAPLAICLAALKAVGVNV